MGDKSGRERSTTEAEASSDIAQREASPEAVDLIARQLKAMYDTALAQPVPERLLALLDRLGDDPSKT